MVDASGTALDVVPASLMEAPQCVPSINKDITACLNLIASKGYGHARPDAGVAQGRDE